MSIIKSSSLPEDLEFEILLYLPAKTLVRFKSVSKSWLALIESSNFIHRHAAITTDAGTFIFQSRHRSLNNLVSWNFYSISDDHEMLENVGMPPCYRYPRGWRDDLFMVGSCNGVICLQDVNHRHKNVSLWNPAIHQFRLVPKSLNFMVGSGNGELYKDFVAFGFDVKTKDYKLVKITYYYPSNDQGGIYHTSDISKHPHRVQVYSLSTNSWKPLDDNLVMNAHPHLQRESGGGYFNGSYYCFGWKWIRNTNIDETLVMKEVILSFDFTKEIFKTMLLPDGMNNMSIDVFRQVHITFLGGKIGVIDYHMGQNEYEFWILNEAECGVKESWSKIYTIGSPYDSVNRRFIGVSNDGEFIFMVISNGATETLCLFNTFTQEMKEFQCDDNQKIMRANVYRSSLVPVCLSKCLQK